MTPALLIFARYPQPGRCKTRLIATLGEQGAAALQEEMTRHTLSWAEKLSQLRAVTRVVHFDGADAEAMSSKFGTNLRYARQEGGDLGDRMRQAAVQSFNQGAQGVLIVGTDCPELNEELAAAAIRCLETHDVCIAPATDGGYTMLGIANQTPQRLTTLLDALFSGIPWGTDRVLSQTAQQLMSASLRVSLRVSLLPTCSDVDLPADLPAARKALAGEKRPSPKLSVVIPNYGVEERLGNAIASARSAEDVEVIVSDAGSAGNALTTAAQSRSQLIVTQANRSHQLNAGAAHANGETLLFLHADTLLPSSFLADILQALENPAMVGGAFRLRIDSSKLSMRLIEKGVHVRTRLLRMPYGDQAIFVRKGVFDEMGGFAEQPIMEDYEFMRRLKRRGRIAVLAKHVTTSARRWERIGPLRTTLNNQLMIIGYHAGVSLDRLARFYRGRPSQ